MAGMGTKRKFTSLSREGPVSGAKRTLKTLEIAILKDRFRHQAGVAGFPFYRIASGRPGEPVAPFKRSGVNTNMNSNAPSSINSR